MSIRIRRPDHHRRDTGPHPQEREIVTLAAGGLSNRQIAQRPAVSVRTVENHLHRAYAKLGTSNRAELAALLPATNTNCVPTPPKVSSRLLTPPRCIATTLGPGK